MVSNVHYVKVRGNSELHVIREWNWKGQSITYYDSRCNMTFVVPFSSVEFMMDTDPEVENMHMTYLLENY